MNAGDRNEGRLPQFQQQELTRSSSGNNVRAGTSGRKRTGGTGYCQCCWRGSFWLVLLCFTVLNTLPLFLLEDVDEDAPSEQEIFEGKVEDAQTLTADASRPKVLDALAASSETLNLSAPELDREMTPDAKKQPKPKAHKGDVVYLRSPEDLSIQKVNLNPSTNKTARGPRAPPKRGQPKPKGGSHLESGGSLQVGHIPSTSSNVVLPAGDGLGDSNPQGHPALQASIVLPDSTGEIDLDAVSAMSDALKAVDAEIELSQTITEILVHDTESQNHQPEELLVREHIHGSVQDLDILAAFSETLNLSESERLEIVRTPAKRKHPKPKAYTTDAVSIQTPEELLEPPTGIEVSSDDSVNHQTHPHDAPDKEQIGSTSQKVDQEEFLDFSSLVVKSSDLPGETVSVKTEARTNAVQEHVKESKPKPKSSITGSAGESLSSMLSAFLGTPSTTQGPAAVKELEPQEEKPATSESERLLESQLEHSELMEPPPKLKKKRVPLPKRYSNLLKVMARTPLLLTGDRVHDRPNRYKRISCGGTEVVEWRTWNEMLNSADGVRLNQTLPAHQPLLPALAMQVRDSLCFNRTVYKRKNCTMSRELWEDDPALEHFPKPTCAVVGNSGRLRNEHHAERIEACDMVFRFNQGRTQGFEKMVGSKASFRMFNAPFVSPKQPGEVTVAQLRGDALRTWVSHVVRRGVENSLAYVFDPEFLCHAWDWVARAGKKPSSGLVGIMFAMKICKKGEVNVFGFGYDDYFNKSMRPHYYDWERPKPGRENVHPFAQERELLDILEAAGHLRLFI